MSAPRSPAPRRQRPRGRAALGLTLLLSIGCGDRGRREPEPESRVPCASANPLRNLYFGDLHVHTANSFDAFMFDVRNTPDDAYRFARGAPLRLPPLDGTGQGTRQVRLDRPLDFAAVTDHSEFLGEVEVCSIPGSPGYDSRTCREFRTGGNTGVTLFGLQLTDVQPIRLDEVCGVDGHGCDAAAGSVWAETVRAAEDAYDRTEACGFTSFIAYEYTAAPSFSTLHRNVIFRSQRTPAPVSFFERPTPLQLWQELRAACVEGMSGCDVLAIPHNSNESNGRMFRVEYPGAVGLDQEREQARLRAELEPLVEIYQHKAASECVSGLAGVVGAPDEGCAFEATRRDPLEDCGDGVGIGGAGRRGCLSRLDFARGALLAGLGEAARIGVNPYPLGLIASTDTHNGTPGAVEEDLFVGHRGLDDGAAAQRLGQGTLTPGGIEFSPGGLVAVWAEQNARGAIFDALRRREAYGTSGPRIAVRLFGGWSFGEDLCADPELVRRGYAEGVPMGASLPPAPSSGAAPTLVISALQDPGSTRRAGDPLERIQVVKGWIADGVAHEQVLEVARAPGPSSTVDESSCVTSGGGAPSLCAVYRDAQFDPGQHAFYYARVLQVPTCRWSARECAALSGPNRPAGCDDPTIPKAIQERAWTSPLWYLPPGR